MTPRKRQEAFSGSAQGDGRLACQLRKAQERTTLAIALLANNRFVYYTCHSSGREVRPSDAGLEVLERVLQRVLRCLMWNLHIHDNNEFEKHNTKRFPFPVTVYTRNT